MSLSDWCKRQLKLIESSRSARPRTLPWRSCFAPEVDTIALHVQGQITLGLSRPPHDLQEGMVLRTCLVIDHAYQLLCCIPHQGNPFYTLCRTTAVHLRLPHLALVQRALNMVIHIMSAFFQRQTAQRTNANGSGDCYPNLSPGVHLTDTDHYCNLTDLAVDHQGPTRPDSPRRYTCSRAATKLAVSKLKSSTFPPSWPTKEVSSEVSITSRRPAPPANHCLCALASRRFLLPQLCQDCASVHF